MALEEGTRLQYVCGPENSEGGPSYIAVTGNRRRAKSIVVVTVAGQYGRVPWAHAEMEDGTTVLLNLALMEEVGLLKEEDRA